MRRFLLLSAILVSFNFIGFGQDFSNKGKEFWITYSHHIRMLQPTAVAEAMQLYITSDVNTTGLVEIASVGFSQTFTVTANQITVVNIPRTAALIDEGQYNHGIKVTSVSPIVVYSFIYVGAISGATLCLPTTVLGREYYSVNYDQLSNEPTQSYSYFNVIATEDGTQVEIKPTVATKGGRAANVPFTVTLNKGQVYQVLATNDLTGSTIKSISGGMGGCKRIAVFCGSGKISIGCNPTATGSSDNLYQQMYPNTAWGKQYVTVPTTNQSSTSNFQTNFYRIIRPDATSTVKLNGVVIPNASFVNNLYHQFSANTPGFIESDKPILVAQYFTTSGTGGTPAVNCGNSGIGDPDMVYLNPLEQTISKVTLNSMQPSSNTAITTHFLNVVTKNVPGAINSFKLDGISQASKFVPLPTNTAYAYARLNVTALGHNLTCDSGFNATAYGFGNAESYAYSAGSNVIDLYQFVTIRNSFASINSPATCINTPFNVAITLPYQPVSIVWDFNNSPNITPNTNVTINPPVGQMVVPADSSFIRDGKTLYTYKLNQLYNYNATGTYPIKVIVNNPTLDGCTGLQEIPFDVQVFNPPIANFNITHNGCLTSPIQFTDASNAGARPLIRWDWNFGDMTAPINQNNPTKTYAAPGTYNVNYRITTDVGCIKDTTKQITISSAPVAKFGVTDTTCVNTALTFTDSSTIATGTIVKWYWDFGNGRKDTLTSNTPRTVTYTATGAISVSLIVESNTGCKSIAFVKNFNVSPFPIVDFTLPGNVCLPTGLANFTNNSYNPGTGASGLKYLWSFGDGNTSTATNPSNLYTSTGPFTVSLRVDNVIGCRTSDSKTFSTIYPKPNAVVTAAKNLICLRDTAQVFDNTNVGAGNTISKWFYGWSSGGFRDTTQNLKIYFPTSGNKTVQLFIQTDKGCFSDTANVTIDVNPLPTGGFSISPIRCEKNAITFTDTSKANASAINEWKWFFSNGSNYVKTTNAPFTESFDPWGNYNAKLVVKTANGCIGDTVTSNFTVNPLPKPGFILPEVCLKDAAAFFVDTSKIADGSNMTNQWNFGDPAATPANPNTSNSKNSSHKYSQTGNYPVQLKVTSINGCIDSTQQFLTVNGSIPKANFTVLNIGNLCSNDSVRIQNISTVDFGSITKVEIVWDTVNAPTVRYLDDFPAPNKQYSNLYPNFQTPVSKTIYVKFISFSGGSCKDSITKAIVLHQSPKVQFLTIPGICNDTTPRLITQATEIGGVAGTFAFTGTGVTTNGLYTPGSVAAGTYPIKYVYRSNTFNCADSATKNITVWPSPVAKWGISSPSCEKNNITFTDSSVANFSNIVSWQWNFADGNTANNANGNAFTKQYSNAGNYNVSLRVVTDSGCRSTPNVQNIRVNDLPRVNFGLPSICLPDGRGTFTDSSKIPDNSEALFRYNWSFGDAANPTGSMLKNPTHQYSALGPYWVKLIVTSKDNCVDSSTKQLATVYPQPKAGFTVSADTICIRDTIFFVDTSKGITSPPNRWNWTINGIPFSNSQNHWSKFTDSGTFKIQLHVFNAQNCVSDTANLDVEVLPYPVLTIGPNLFFLQGGSLTIIPQKTWGKNLSYAWIPNDGSLDSVTVRNPRAAPLQDTRYTLALTGLGGCTVTDTVLVTVLKAPIIPNSFSPNGDGINDTWSIKYLESYPGCTIQVFDRGGRLVFNSIGYSRDWMGTFQGQPLPVGTYYYIVDPKNGRQKISGSVSILR